VQHGTLDFSGQRALAKGIQDIGTRGNKRAQCILSPALNPAADSADSGKPDAIYRKSAGCLGRGARYENLMNSLIRESADFRASHFHYFPRTSSNGPST